ncbi:uncharacterized protein LOC130985133 [Salvia miltiorrhiza]|uniref:uncharacterized protein LOC130985133 n=1 Tax=Salvia miltiorrhiza TaxID=226208 RepID=UPI0025AC58AB|nr:uncharacterized protein LOC130985133 [Salvia miltiorrhiza]
MGDEEINYLQKIQQEDNICDSMHHLSTACDQHPAAAACGNSGKRQSPLSRSLFQEPLPKRATFNSPSSAAGYKKLSLPRYSAAAPPLLRANSEPIYSPCTANSAAAPPQSSEFPTSPVPIRIQPRQEMLNVNVDQESYQLQENLRRPSLCRTVSAPIPAGTPPRPPARRNPSSRSPNSHTKRLKRIKKRLREISEWWNQVASEDDDDDENLESENVFTDKEECEEQVESPLEEEAVLVEKTGECLALHFKCPCGNGYQILLSGNNCYYKLTTF